MRSPSCEIWRHILPAAGQSLGRCRGRDFCILRRLRDPWSPWNVAPCRHRVGARHPYHAKQSPSGFKPCRFPISQPCRMPPARSPVDVGWTCISRYFAAFRDSESRLHFPSDRIPRQIPLHLQTVVYNYLHRRQTRFSHRHFYIPHKTTRFSSGAAHSFETGHRANYYCSAALRPRPISRTRHRDDKSLRPRRRSGTIAIMHILTTILLSLSLSHYTTAATDDKKTAPKPCTIHSPTTGSYIDLSPLTLTPQCSGGMSNESYHAKGYDYPYNFTLNFCERTVENLTDVKGIKERQWANVSAYYRDSNDDVVSIGQQNSELLFRGKKLLLNYTMGSPCPDLDEDGQPIPDRRYLDRREIVDDDPDDDEADDGKEKDNRKSHSKAIRRKTTMMTFTCDTSPLLVSRPAITFLGTPDHCTYMFEVRSRHVCGGTTTHHESGTLGPASVFLVISGIALLVYLVGGVVYQRNVMHQRGWRQLPNYALWAGLFSFVSVRDSSSLPLASLNL